MLFVLQTFPSNKKTGTQVDFLSKTKQYIFLEEKIKMKNMKT